MNHRLAGLQDIVYTILANVLGSSAEIHADDYHPYAFIRKPGRPLVSLGFYTDNCTAACGPTEVYVGNGPGPLRPMQAIWACIDILK